MLEETWDGGIGVLRSRIASGANTWDVVQVESEELLIGAEEGLFEPLDWAAIGGRDAYIPQAVNDFGVGAILYSFVIAFDRARMPQGPAQLGGVLRHRALPRQARRCAAAPRPRSRSR